MHLGPDSTPGRRDVVRSVLHTCVDNGLRCLSPFMPFLTEELYQRVPGAISDVCSSVCEAEYPDPSQVDPLSRSQLCASFDLHDLATRVAVGWCK